MHWARMTQRLSNGGLKAISLHVRRRCRFSQTKSTYSSISALRNPAPPPNCREGTQLRSRGCMELGEFLVREDVDFVWSSVEVAVSEILSRLHSLRSDDLSFRLWQILGSRAPG